MAGISVQFAVQPGAATVVPATATTDVDRPSQDDGHAWLGRRQRHHHGDGGRYQHLNASSSSRLARRARRSRARAGSPQTPAAGAVLPAVSGTGICLGGGTGGCRVRASSRSMAIRTPARLGQVNVTAHGATASRRRTCRRSATSFATPQRGPALITRVSERPQEQFDLQLARDRARRELTPLDSRGARVRCASGARFNRDSANSLTIGPLVTLNANGIGSVRERDQHHGARRGGIEHGDRRRRHGESAPAASPTRSTRRSRRRSTR